jgi:ketosteroid isomerase-like protein
MSQENVEIVRRAMEEFNRGDIDAAVKEAAPNAEFDWSRALGPYRGVYRLDQIRREMKDFTATFESARWEPEEFIDAGEHVVMVGTVCLRGRDRIEATARTTFVSTIRDGAIERVSLYQERQDALEAVGLSEQDAHADS